MKPPETSKIHDAEASVYQRYAAAAQATEPALCCPVEYAADFLTVIPDEIIERDYGCGDPTPFVQPGDTVLDLGSGAGKLCYIAAQVTGAKGRVIGIDCNQEVLSLARKHIETRNWQETTCKTETRKDNAIACFSQMKAVVHRCSGTHQSSETPRLSSEFWRIRLQRSATAFPEVVIRLLARKF